VSIEDVENRTPVGFPGVLELEAGIMIIHVGQGL